MTNVPGGWILAPIQSGGLPEGVASAFSDVTLQMTGAKYIPVLYCGKQVVHGTNHMIICKQTLAVQDATEHIVTMVINCSEHGNSIVEIQTII